MTEPRLLMLVTSPADASLRDGIAADRRPCPEYIALEGEHGVEIVDWSALRGTPKRRTRVGAALLALASIPRVKQATAVLSDGEPVGVPLALMMRALRIATPHVMIGHHLTARHKRPFFTVLRSQRRIDRILVHSRRQIELLGGMGIPAHKLAFVHYHADTHFWRPIAGVESNLVVAAGREHRDYVTLARAAVELDAEIFIADGSVHSPGARTARERRLPPNVRTGYLDYVDLRNMYARAKVVVVPLLPNDFQAGITTLLEAMAMGKAVVATQTGGQQDVLDDGVNCITVPPQDPQRLREAIEFLLDHPDARVILGAQARWDVLHRHSLGSYARSLAAHLHEVGLLSPATAIPAAAGGRR